MLWIELWIDLTHAIFPSRLFDAKYRACATDTLLSLTSTDCKEIWQELMACRADREYDYGIKCKPVRQALQECVAKNKIGEFGKKYI